MMDRRETGFTLTEALIATAVLSVLTLSVLLAIRTIVDADRGLRRTVGSVEERLLFNEVVRDLARYSFRPPRAETTRRFVGTPTGFSTLILAPGEPSARYANLSIEGGAVSLSLSPLGPNSSAATVQLYDGAASVSARYLGRPADERQLGWFSNWSEDSPPRLISIEIQEENGQIWRIDALLEGQGSFDCNINRETGTCMEL